LAPLLELFKPDAVFSAGKSYISGKQINHEPTTASQATGR